MTPLARQVADLTKRVERLEALRADELQGSEVSLRQVVAIQKHVAQRYGVTRFHLLSASMEGDAVFARHVAMAIARKLTDVSLQIIAALFARESHATVSHAIDGVRLRCELHPEINNKVNVIVAECREIIATVKPWGTPQEDSND